MDLKYFANKTWRHSEEIEYTHPTTKIIVSCMLLAVDFEQELFKLIPIDTEYYNDLQSFWVRVEYCEKIRRRLTIKK